MVNNEFSRTYAEKIRTYKANVRTIEMEVDKLKSEFRMYNTRIDKLESRYQQIIILFKMILVEYNKNYRTRHEKPILINDIISYLDKTVREYKPNEGEEDLIDNIISKQNQSEITIGLNPGEHHDWVWKNIY